MEKMYDGKRKSSQKIMQQLNISFLSQFTLRIIMIQLIQNNESKTVTYFKGVSIGLEHQYCCSTCFCITALKECTCEMT